MAKLKVSPSKLDLAALCPAAPRLCAPFPFTKTPASERGSDLHDRAALIMQTHGEARDAALDGLNEKDSADLDMAINVAKQLIPAGEHQQFVEEKLDLAFLGMGNGGTLDLAFFHQESGWLSVADYKFGVMPIDSPLTNRQLIAYALGMVRKLQAQAYAVTNVFLAVIQPASRIEESFQHGRMTLAELEAWEPQLIADVAAAMQADAAPAPGNHCKGKFCEAAKHPGACPVYDAFAQQRAEAKQEAKVEAAAQAVSGLVPIEVDGLPGPIVVISAEAIARAEDYCKQATAMTVVDQGTADRAGIFLNEVGKYESQIDTNVKQVTARADAFKKKVAEAVAPALSPLKAAKEALKARINTWKQQEEDRREAARQAALKAARQAEADRQAAEAAKVKAEQERKEAEEQAAKATSKAAKAQADLAVAEAARKAAEANAAELKAQLATQQMAAPEPEAPVTVAGTAGGVEPDWTVTDFAGMPDAYKKEDTASLKAAIKSKGWGKKGKEKPPAWLTVEWVPVTKGRGR